MIYRDTPTPGYQSWSLITF